MADSRKTSQAGNPLVCAYGELIRDRRFARDHSGEAEDIGQDAFLRAMAVEDASSIRAPMRYLTRIMRNIFIDRQRQKKREVTSRKLLEPNEIDLRDSLDPERIISARQELERVAIAISRLPPRCRQAFVLHRFDNLSYSAIARRMGISSGTVEKHIAEAMLRIARAANEADGERG